MDTMKGFQGGGLVDATSIDEHAAVLLPGEQWLGAEPSQLDRIEAKLDMLIDALAEEGEEEQAFDLDGNPLPSGGEDGEAL